LAFNGLYGVISQKIELFITTVVRTSNPTNYVMFLIESSKDLEDDGFNTNHPYFHCLVVDAISDNDLCMVVGYAVYYYTYSTWQGKAIYLEDIYVMPEYRKHGLGSSLFAKVAKVSNIISRKRAWLHLQSHK
jgi:GNAT superfamily N-acetyltransferase